MFNNQEINWNEVKESDYMKLPAGKYKIVIEAANTGFWDEANSKVAYLAPGVRESSKDFIELKVQVLDGAHRYSKDNLSLRLWADNDQAANIARSKFKQLCSLFGLDPSVNRIAELNDKICFVTLTNSKKVKDDGTPYVNIGKFEEVKENNQPVKTNANANASAGSKEEDDDVPF